MPKTFDDRIQAGLTAIEENAGRPAREWVELRLPPNTDIRMVELQLGNRGPIHFSSETRRRNLVRGVLLAYMATDMSWIRLAMAKEAVKKESEQELVSRLKKFLPSTQIVGNFNARATWGVSNFTDPTNHNVGNFRYIITGVVKAPVKIGTRGFLASEEDATKFLQAQARFPANVLTITSTGKDKTLKETLNILPAKRYLGDPSLLKYDVISTSLIDQNHVAAYFPWGFILRVPPECIISAQYRDQGVVNRPQNIVTEMERVHREKGLATPGEILAATNGVGGETGYNEVVVLGHSPEGRQVSVVGIFVKVAPNGNLYNRQQDPDNTPYVADLVNDIQTCSRNHGIPVVKIPDAASKASTTAWPF